MFIFLYNSPAHFCSLLKSDPLPCGKFKPIAQILRDKGIYGRSQHSKIRKWNTAGLRYIQLAASSESILLLAGII